MHIAASRRKRLFRQPGAFEGFAVRLKTRSPHDAQKYSSISRSKRWPPIRQENNPALRVLRGSWLSIPGERPGTQRVLPNVQGACEAASPLNSLREHRLLREPGGFEGFLVIPEELQHHHLALSQGHDRGGSLISLDARLNAREVHSLSHDHDGPGSGRLLPKNVAPGTFPDATPALLRRVSPSASRSVLQAVGLRPPGPARVRGPPPQPSRSHTCWRCRCSRRPRSGPCRHHP
jgi:hypothetical protein